MTILHGSLAFPKVLRAETLTIPLLDFNDVYVMNNLKRKEFLLLEQRTGLL